MSDLSVWERLEVLEKELAKTRWQLQRVADGMTGEGHGMGRFIVLRDVTEGELKKLHDVFEKYDNILNADDGDVGWIDFDCEVLKALPHDDIEVFEVVSAMQDDNRWVKVCEAWRERQ